MPDSSSDTSRPSGGRLGTGRRPRGGSGWFLTVSSRCISRELVALAGFTIATAAGWPLLDQVARQRSRIAGHTPGSRDGSLAGFPVRPIRPNDRRKRRRLPKGP